MGKTIDQLAYHIEHKGSNEKTTWTVYVHTFPNGKRYVGITSQRISTRWGHNGHGYRSQAMLTRAINKYGWNNIKHEILRIVETKSEAEMLEKHYISEFMSDNRKYGYNIASGGFCAKGYKLSNETKMRMSESRRGEKNWNYGMHLSEETKAKLSESHKGKRINKEALMLGIEKRRGSKAYNARTVLQLNKQGKIIARYGSIAEARDATGIRSQDIYNCCKGRQKTTHGTRWMYAD